MQKHLSPVTRWICLMNSYVISLYIKWQNPVSGNLVHLAETSYKPQIRKPTLEHYPNGVSKETSQMFFFFPNTVQIKVLQMFQIFFFICRTKKITGSKWHMHIKIQILLIWLMLISFHLSQVFFKNKFSLGDECYIDINDNLRVLSCTKCIYSLHYFIHLKQFWISLNFHYTLMFKNCHVYNFLLFRFIYTSLSFPQSVVLLL